MSITIGGSVLSGSRAIDEAEQIVRTFRIFKFARLAKAKAKSRQLSPRGTSTGTSQSSSLLSTG